MLIDQIKSDLVAALKGRESLRAGVLRMVLSELNYRQIAVQRELTENDVLEVVAREVKKRREAIESYRAGGREDQARVEEEELEILDTYMPVMMSEENIREELAKMELPKDFGAAMKIASPLFKGRAEGGLVAKLVKELCQ